MMSWQVQEAKNKLSEVIDRTESEGPQVITRRGKKVAVMLSVKEYDKLAKQKMSLVQFFRSSPLVGKLDLQRHKDSTRRIIEL